MSDKNGKIAVIGGAGYVGSFTTRALRSLGFDVVVVDNFSSGHKEAVGDVEIEEIDILEEENRLTDLFKEKGVTSVIHFAALIQMGESMNDPAAYFRHNVLGSINVFEAARKTGISSIVFSSSAGVYGNPEKVPIPEEHPLNPTNPYGESKAMVEKILRWYWEIFKIPSVSVRYFNAAGGSLDGKFGEDHKNESHLIPRLIKAALTGDQVTIFGNDYKTCDGTCVRDYIHVLDLAHAHIRALKFLQKSKGAHVFNAGTGNGYSNLQVLRKIEDVSGKKIDFVFGERRMGDAEELIADPQKAKQVLSWIPKYSDLETIIRTAWLWHKNHPNGYSGV